MTMAPRAFGWSCIVVVALLLCPLGEALPRSASRRELQATGAATACPAAPLDLCAFYISGQKTTIPTLAFTNMTSESQPLSADLLLDAPTPLGVTNANSAQVLFFIPGPDGTKADRTNPAFDSVFYLNGSPPQVFIRNVQNINVQALTGRCIQLMITSAQLLNVTQTINLSDISLTNIPAEKRCVVFKT